MRKIIGLIAFLVGTGYVSGEPLNTPRFELGPIIGSTAFGTAFAKDMRFGLGARFALNLNPRFAIEYQMARIQGEPYYSANSSTQGSGHVKWKFWRNRAGTINLFAVAGPGFMHQEDQYASEHQIINKLRSIAIDYGGGIEVVPYRHVSIRLDCTDFYAGTKYQGSLIALIPPYFYPLQSLVRSSPQVAVSSPKQDTKGCAIESGKPLIGKPMIEFIGL
jgi:hypothetical protein